MNDNKLESKQASKIKVCVCMVAYNQTLFIEDAIKGVLMQEADFEIQLVIGEDCSTDNTRQICEHYAKQYPNKIQLLESTKNHGIHKNVFRTIKACQDSTYIAFCEGDDVWVDKHKLRYQVNLLEANKKFQAHAHNVTYRNVTTNEDSNFGELADRELSVKDLFMGWPFHVVSLIIRSELIRKIPTDELPHFISCDKFFNMWVGCHGILMYEGTKFFAIYHRHEFGASGTPNWIQIRQQDLAMLSFLRGYLNDESLYREVRLNAIKNLFFASASIDSPISIKKWPLLLEFIRFASFTKRTNIWFFCLILFGRPFYKFVDILKKPKKLLQPLRFLP